MWVSPEVLLTPFGALSTSESSHLLGTGWALPLALTPSGPDHGPDQAPLLEAGGSSVPVRVRPACVCVWSRSPLWASWPQEEVLGP